ncbi:MAG: cytochrome c [Gemmatimonadetes bacterium]|nr:cytochrome c [Gemmatimonadota bacterium]
MRSALGMLRAIRLTTPLLVALVPVVFPTEAFSQNGTVTFTKDVAPILQENCVRCHRENSIAPMSLRTYEKAKPYAYLMKEMVSRRLMPPFHYDHDVGIQELKSDWRLSDEEIATIVAWVDGGALAGDPTDMPAQREFAPYNDWMLKGVLGREPDHVVESKPFTVPAEGGDLWWRPVVPVGVDRDRKVKAIETRPSFPDGTHVVHHAIPRLLLKNEKGEWEQAATFSEYAMGKVGEIIPKDAYRVLPKDGLIQWDAHYYPPGHEVKDDVVKVGFWFYEDDEAPKYTQDLKLYPLQGDIDLAPGGTAMTQGFFRWDHPVRLDAFQAHGHVHLHAMSAQAVYPDGKVELLSMVTNFSARWHHSYLYQDDAAPLLPTGTVLVVTGWYDNTAKNPLATDPGTWVARGSRTTDEMSHAWIAVSHLDEEGYQRIAEERKQRKVASTKEEGSR